MKSLLLSRLCLLDWGNGHLSFSIDAFIRDAFLTVTQKVPRIDCDVSILTLHRPVEKNLSLVFHSVFVYQIGVQGVFLFFLIGHEEKDGYLTTSLGIHPLDMSSYLTSQHSRFQAYKSP